LQPDFGELSPEPLEKRSGGSKKNIRVEVGNFKQNRLQSYHTIGLTRFKKNSLSWNKAVTQILFSKRPDKRGCGCESVFLNVFND